VAIREILRFPHPLLKQVAEPVGGRHELAAELAADLVDTMREHSGCVGLAANQIGELVRVVVVDVSDHPKAESSNGLLVLCDPRIAAAEGSEIAREGCLSIPELTANVRRATRVTVEAMTLAGERLRVESEGFEARCVQHELDHLDGLLFLDRVESLRDDVFRRKQRQ
jgi:peptide deformylase